MFANPRSVAKWLGGIVVLAVLAFGLGILTKKLTSSNATAEHEADVPGLDSSRSNDAARVSSNSNPLSTPTNALPLTASSGSTSAVTTNIDSSRRQWDAGF